MLAWIAEFIGRILKHILPGLIAEAKKPKEVKMVGGDDEVHNDIINTIDDHLDRV